MKKNIFFIAVLLLFVTLEANAQLAKGLLTLKPKQFTLTYDSQGGTPVPSITFYPNEYVTIADGPSLSGSYFEYWNTQPDGSGSSYQAGNVVKMYAYDLVLYAMFAVEYYVYYDTQGGSYVPGAVSLPGHLVMLPNAPFRAGYRFVEWNTLVSGNGVSYAPGDFFVMPYHDITIYTIWEFDMP